MRKILHIIAVDESIINQALDEILNSILRISVKKVRFQIDRQGTSMIIKVEGGEKYLKKTLYTIRKILDEDLKPHIRGKTLKLVVT